MIRYVDFKYPEKVTSCGIPQGAILGPLMFILYNIDLAIVVMSVTYLSSKVAAIIGM